MLTVNDFGIVVQPLLVVLVLLGIRILLPELGIVLNAVIDTAIGTSGHF